MKNIKELHFCFSFLFIMITLSFFSCGKEEKIVSKENASFQNRNTELIISRGKFNSFFIKFVNDSLFQKERISNQVKLYSYNESDKLDVSIYNKKDFTFMDFRSDSSAHKKEFNKYSIETKVEKDSVTYYNLGIDNGIHTFYVFKRKVINKWYLTSIHDYSN